MKRNGIYYFANELESSAHCSILLYVAPYCSRYLYRIAHALFVPTVRAIAVSLLFERCQVVVFGATRGKAVLFFVCFAPLLTEL